MKSKPAAFSSDGMYNKLRISLIGNKISNRMYCIVNKCLRYLRILKFQRDVCNIREGGLNRGLHHSFCTPAYLHMLPCRFNYANDNNTIFHPAILLYIMTILKLKCSDILEKFPAR